MRRPIDSLILENTLREIHLRRNSSVLDAIESGALVLQGNEENLIKNVCAKVPVSVYDGIHEVCTRLRIPKRRFLEAAMVDAILRASAIMKEEGLDDLDQTEGLGLQFVDEADPS